MESLKNIFYLDPSTKLTLPKIKTEGFKIIFLFEDTKAPSNLITEEYEDGAPLLPFAATEVHRACVVGARVLCVQRDGFKPVYELSLDVQNTSIADSFNPGDTIGVIPKNRIKDVNLILERLNLTSKADLHYVIENNVIGGKSQIPKHVPFKSTLRNILTNCLELGAVVKKLFIRALASYCSVEEDQKCLELMCSKEGSELYVEHILNKNVSVVDILNEFPSCKPSLVCLLTHLPRLLPRSYSILNSRLTNKNIVKICFSVAEISPMKRGLTTEWLEIIANKVANNGELNQMFDKLAIDEDEIEVKIPIYLKKNVLFVLPNESEKIIMVGPGTGVAPFIGFLEERNAKKERNPSINLGESWLFFGCRDGNIDHIYKDELEAFVDKQVLTRITCTFSRVDNNKIKYVQDAIKLHSKEVSDLIMNGAHIYVCGDLSVMAKQVEEAFVSSVEVHTERTHEQAVDFFKKLQKEKRYMMDAWS